MTPHFERIRPERMGEVWPVVEYGLKRAKTKGVVPWEPIHVLEYIISGRATLYFAVADERVLGFCVLQVIEEPFSGETILHIWCVFAAGEESNHADAFDYADEFNAFIDEIARSMSIERVQWLGRPGWARALKKRGVTVRQTLYERSVAPQSNERIAP